MTHKHTTGFFFYAYRQTRKKHGVCRLYSMHQIALCQAVFWCLPMFAMADLPQTAPIPPSLELIEQKLSQIDVDARFYGTAQSKELSTITGYDNVNSEAIPISMIGTSELPLGLTAVVVPKEDIIGSNPSAPLQMDTAPIPPTEDILEDTPTLEVVDTPQSPSAIKKLYNHLFNDGVEKAERLKVRFYQDKIHNEETTVIPQKLSRKMVKQEPFANIKATLEDMTVQSIADFKGATPRLRQAIRTAAAAVGYYDMEFGLIKEKTGEIGVIIHHLGEPVVIDHRIVDIRGDGANNQIYKDGANTILPVGKIFNHGEYEAGKTDIMTLSGEHGYFDGRWLDSSVDVILPDNTADINLIYDTGVQYQFGDVVFFTIDPDTGQYTTDPDKLPVRLELLKKLVNFEMSDAYNRTAVRDLSNDLLATRYFNTVNTQSVLPSKTQEDIEFESITEELLAAADDADETDVSQTVELGDGVVATVAPIEFSTSQAIAEKLVLVTQKADRLYNAPEDRVLATDTDKQSKNILGRISDAVSGIAKMILPDESTDVLSESEQPDELAGRKSPAAVYQDKKVPLYIFVAADKPRDAQIGLGWGSDSGTRFIGKFEHNLVNKQGVQAGVDLRWSENKQGLQTYLSRPMSHPLNDKLKFHLGYEEESVGQGVGNFGLSSRTLETGISRNIIKANGWNRTYSLRYRLDELDTDVPTHLYADLPVHFQGGKPTQQALLAGYGMSKTVADDVVNPMRGYRQQYSVEIGSDKALTDTTMAIVKAGISGIYSFGDNTYGKERAHQLIAGVQGGYILTKHFDDVPYKLRFFAGGDNSIRGYNYQSLSPLSDKGYLLGGQSLLVGSVEYNYELLEGLRLAVFADVGNAYDKQFHNQTKIGTGVGVRWASPVGQVRVDLATGIKEEHNQIKLHFFIGTPF